LAKFVRRIVLPAADCYKHPYAGYRGSKVRKEMKLLKQQTGYSDLRKNLLVRQNFLCAYCRSDLSGKRANLEHILPVKRGGTNKLDNLVMSCPDCNKVKNNKLYGKKTRLKIKVLSRY